MILKVIYFLSKFFPLNIAYAHCDIPCGIYDPHLAQVASHTVLRMTQMLAELDSEKNKNSSKQIHQIARLTKVKEEHAELIKHEIRIIWGDYFKNEHLAKFPNLHQIVFNIMKLASKARQDIDLEAAKELLLAVQEFSAIFYQSKGLETIRVKAPYPTGEEIVYHK